MPSPLILAQSETPSPDVSEALAEVGDLATSCADGGAVCTWVLDLTGNEVLAGLVGTLLPILFSILLVFIAAAILTRLVKRLISAAVTRTARESQDAIARISRRAPSLKAELSVEEREVLRERNAQRARTLASVAGSIAAFAIWAIAIFIALAQLRINIAPLLAGFSVIGVALGFGAQSLVKDFLSGIFMLLEDQYGVGDIVDVGEATGAVEAVTLRVTRLRDVEGTVWHVPNGEITRVGNLSQLWSRSLLDIGVAYDTDLELASEVLKEVAHGMATDPEWDPEILDEPELWGVEQFGPSEIVLRLVMKTKPASQWKVNREFRRRVKIALDAAGIEIPFPQRTIWVKEGAAAGVPAAATLPAGPVGGDPAEAAAAVAEQSEGAEGAGEEY